MKCRACASEKLMPVLSLGSQPLPNRFLTQEQLDQPEPSFPLELVYCEGCSLMQLKQAVPTDVTRLMFSSYDYASSASASFRAHFEQLADWLYERFKLYNHSLVVEIGSNDGVLLKPLGKLGIPAVGVEPALNLVKLCQAEGLRVVPEFFGEKVVDVIGPGAADVVVACNVFAHIEDIHGVMANVKRLLKPEGAFVCEVQYLGDMLRTLQYDNIYLEHIFYWTATSLARFFSRAGFTLVGAMRVDTHGGSLRAVAVPAKAKGDGRFAVVGKSIAQYRWSELRAGITAPSAYVRFAAQVSGQRQALLELVYSLEGRVVGYGAPAKSTTLLNYCRGLANALEYVVDDSPLKQGKYTPGTHLPIHDPDMLRVSPPDHIVILAWNYAEAIMAKTAHIGADYVLPAPPKLVKSGAKASPV